MPTPDEQRILDEQNRLRQQNEQQTLNIGQPIPPKPEPPKKPQEKKPEEDRPEDWKGTQRTQQEELDSLARKVQDNAENDLYNQWGNNLAKAGDWGIILLLQRLLMQDAIANIKGVANLAADTADLQGAIAHGVGKAADYVGWTNVAKYSHELGNMHYDYGNLAREVGEVVHEVAMDTHVALGQDSHGYFEAQLAMKDKLSEFKKERAEQQAERNAKNAPKPEPTDDSTSTLGIGGGR